MNPIWSLEELRAHVSGAADYEFLLDLIHSIDRTVSIFRYHFVTAREALRDFIDEGDPIGKRNTSYVYGNAEQQEEYDDAKIASEANIISCIYASRNMFDIFSQLVNRLVLGSSISIHNCNIEKVKSSLPDSELKNQISLLLELDWYAYVVGFSNTAKHRRLISHQFSISFDQNFAGIRVGAFDYKGRSFPSYWLEEVLEGLLDVKNKIIDCGRALNYVCGASND